MVSGKVHVYGRSHRGDCADRAGTASSRDAGDFTRTRQWYSLNELSRAERQDILCETSTDVVHRLRAVRRTRERAEKRLQIITKEADWRVAKVYVALADEEDLDEFRAQYDLKQKENVGAQTGTQRGAGSHYSNLEMAALDRYLEDDEWEAGERREGRSATIPKFPLPSKRESLAGKWFTWK